VGWGNATFLDPAATSGRATKPGRRCDEIARGYRSPLDPLACRQGEPWESTVGPAGQRSEVGEVTEALRRAAREPDRSAAAPSEPDEASTPAPCQISRSREGDWQARAVLVNRPGPQLDQFRRFALRVRRSLAARDAKSVLVTSALQGEGKTVVACNLALALSSMAAGNRIALVDLDLHRPSVAKAMGIAPGPGIEAALAGDKSIREVRIRTDLPALDLFPGARPIPGCHELLARPALRSLLEALSKDYATVVCDGPPTLLAPDLELIAPHVGGCVLVGRAGLTRKSRLREVLRILPREKMIGTFLNYSSLPRHARYYSQYAALDPVEAGGEPEEPWDDIKEVNDEPGGRHDG
jgi:Mrp family chromosome partitioning ATPase